MKRIFAQPHFDNCPICHIPLENSECPQCGYDDTGDEGIVGCGDCGKVMKRENAYLVPDERVYICGECLEFEE